MSALKDLLPKIAHQYTSLEQVFNESDIYLSFGEAAPALLAEYLRQSLQIDERLAICLAKSDGDRSLYVKTLDHLTVD